ncbi:MAG: type I DNA topoisomerase [Gemmataceae bacterium]
MPRSQSTKKAKEVVKARGTPAQGEQSPQELPARGGRTSTRKAKNLVIVESPAKAKTISKYLGPEFEVAASKGHVRDLPKYRFGLDIAGGWVPTYEELRERREVLEDLRKRAAQAALVYLAPDPDREGEAIAWHLKEALRLPEDRVRRVTFNEITRKAVQEAFAHPGSIDMDKVRAQETRRFLDRVVGYQLSPLLRRKVTRGLSAGRVQSVAVRLIVEREREIEAFKPQEYWTLSAVLRVPAALESGALPELRIRRRDKPPAPDMAEDKANGVSPEDLAETADEAGGVEEETPSGAERQPLPADAFVAKLEEWQGQKPSLADEAQARQVAEQLIRADFVTVRVERKEKQEKPPPPFITSTLQQEANIRLRFPARKTMLLAQQLYEGVELGPEGSVALITYMRTDSVRISQEAIAACRELIAQRFGTDYVPEAPQTYVSSESAQEGHEAIRPTDLAYTPERVRPYLSADQWKLYELIYRRFVACQMKPALFEVTTVEVRAGEALFRARGRVQRFDGYRRVYQPIGRREDMLLPSLTEGQRLLCSEIVAQQNYTQPPPRYTEASLVRTLEKEGIGRPSTYATIISKIQERGYVEQRKRRFYATPLGKLVTDLLVQHFPEIMDVKFTSHMESELDLIERRRAHWQDVLNEFYEPFSQSLKQADVKMQAVKGQETEEKCPQCGATLVTRWSKRGEFLGCSRYPECRYSKPKDGSEPHVEMTAFNCPECGKPLVRRQGKLGAFFACSGYPDCRVTMNMDAQGIPVPSVVPTEHTCDRCGQPMVLRQGRRGPFLACSAYPDCKNTRNVDAQGNPLPLADTGLRCEKCGAPMVVRTGRRGPFLACSAYPDCRNARPLPEDLKARVHEFLPRKPDLSGVTVERTCPRCGAPMKVRRGRGNYFLGCSRYPECRGSDEVPPEVLEQIQKLDSRPAPQPQQTA